MYPYNMYLPCGEYGGIPHTHICIPQCKMPTNPLFVSTYRTHICIPQCKMPTNPLFVSTYRTHICIPQCKMPTNPLFVSTYRIERALYTFQRALRSSNEPSQTLTLYKLTIIFLLTTAQEAYKPSIRLHIHLQKSLQKSPVYTSQEPYIAQKSHCIH